VVDVSQILNNDRRINNQSNMTHYQGNRGNSIGEGSQSQIDILPHVQSLTSVMQNIDNNVSQTENKTIPLTIPTMGARYSSN